MIRIRPSHDERIRRLVLEVETRHKLERTASNFVLHSTESAAVEADGRSRREDDPGARRTQRTGGQRMVEDIGRIQTDPETLRFVNLDQLRHRHIHAPPHDIG